MPFLYDLRELLHTDRLASQPPRELAYATDARRFVIYNPNEGPVEREDPTGRVHVPTFQYQRAMDLYNIIASTIVSAAQMHANDRIPAVFVGQNPEDMCRAAEIVLESLNNRLHAILLNPRYTHLVDDDRYRCFVHDDAPIGAILYLPEPQFLGALSLFDDAHLAAIHVRGPVVSILTEPTSNFRDFRPANMAIPTQVRGRSGPSNTLEEPLPVNTAPDVWDRLDKDLF